MAGAKKPSVAQRRAAKLAELKGIIRGRLARFWPPRAARLRRWAARPAPPGTTHLRFEIHAACATLTVCVYAVGAEAMDHVGDLMADLSFPRFDAVPWEGYRRAIGRKAEPVIEEVLVEELRRLWAEAGGASYPVPVVIRWHDSSPAYDLLTGKPAAARFH